jgi:hypothetical protein
MSITKVIVFAGLSLASAVLLAREKVVTIPKGEPVGVVNLMDAELTHYHAARNPHEDFLKIHRVNWSIDEMLDASLRERGDQLGLMLVPLAATDSLAHAREDCFVNVALATGMTKGWPKSCANLLAGVAASAGVNTLIVLAPGLNNAAHGGSSRDYGLSESLRGWGFFTRDGSAAHSIPTLFDETELLLIGITADGGATLIARKWGGTLSLPWQSYTRPADPKALSPEQLAELQPLFAAVLSKQANELLDQVHVSP